MNEQLSLFNIGKKEITITKPIRLIELFAGYGSQAMALKRIGAKFEHHKAIEFDRFAMASYNAVHGTNFEPTDIREVRGAVRNNPNRAILLHTYLFISLYRFIKCRQASRHGERLWDS